MKSKRVKPARRAFGFSVDARASSSPSARANPAADVVRPPRVVSSPRALPRRARPTRPRELERLEKWPRRPRPRLSSTPPRSDAPSSRARRRASTRARPSRRRPRAPRRRPPSRASSPWRTSRTSTACSTRDPSWKGTRARPRYRSRRRFENANRASRARRDAFACAIHATPRRTEHCEAATVAVNAAIARYHEATAAPGGDEDGTLSDVVNTSLKQSEACDIDWLDDKIE